MEINQGLSAANEGYKKFTNSNDYALLLSHGADEKKESGIHFDIAVTIIQGRKIGCRSLVSPLIQPGVNG